VSRLKFVSQVGFTFLGVEMMERLECEHECFGVDGCIWAVKLVCKCSYKKANVAIGFNLFFVGTYQ
jgi:hypothetical protein